MPKGIFDTKEDDFNRHEVPYDLKQKNYKHMKHPWQNNFDTQLVPIVIERRMIIVDVPYDR